jgi:hypothetical protein
MLHRQTCSPALPVLLLLLLSADVSQAAFRFCKFFGKCTFAELRATSSAMLLVNVPM